jgi:hypothetical protein
LQPVSSLFLAGAIGLLAFGGSPGRAEEVVLGFRTDIQPFSYVAPAGAGSEQRPYYGYIADLCYEIFDRSGYELAQVPVSAQNRFKVVRRPDGEDGPPDTAGGQRVRRADGASGPPDTEGGKKVDVLCDATTLRLDDAQRMEAGVFSPLVFVTGVSYLWRSERSFRDVELGYIDNSTAKRVAMEACEVDAFRLRTEEAGANFDTKPDCRTMSVEKLDCLAKLPPPEPGSASSVRPPMEPLRILRKTFPSYVRCPRADHTALIEWFCADTDRDKVYFGDRDIILAKLADWRAKGNDCGDVRDPRQSYTYEPYALLVSRADPQLFRFVQRRVYELFSHRSGAEALFYKWFPGQTLSEPLAWLFVLNGVMDQDELLAGPKQFPNIVSALSEGTPD